MTRQKLQQSPLKAEQLLQGSDQVAQYAKKEQMIAFNILTTALQNFNEQHFVAYVEEDNLLNISKEIMKFLSQADTFVNYQKPPGYLDDSQFKDTLISREEAIRRHALMGTIYEEERAMNDMPLPFVNSEHDRTNLGRRELDYLKKVSLVDHFEDIDQMGIEFDDKTDF